MAEYSLEFIGKNFEALRGEVKELREDVNALKDAVARVEKAQQRFHVCQALVETRQNDIAGDLTAIAKIIDRAGLIR